MSAFEAYVRRVATHASLYAVAPAVGVVTNLAGLVVLTRLLNPTQFGQLALAMTLSSLLTVVYNLGSFQGTNRAGFSTSDADEIAAPDEDRLPVEMVSEHRRRSAVGMGIVLTGLVGCVGTAIIGLMAEPIAHALGHGVSEGTIVFAAAAGGLASVWRLVLNVMRLERRPLAWAITQSSRPLLALGVSVAFLVAGFGVAEVMAAWLVGTAVSLAIGLRFSRRSYRLCWNPAAIVPIYRGGAAIVPAALGFWAIENADVFVLGRFVSTAEIGAYRVAQRLTAPVASLNSAFIMAWGTSTREPIALAADRERTPQFVQGAVISYFAVSLFTVVLAISIFANWLVEVAPRTYAGAAAVVPLLALRWVAKVFLQITYRTAEFRTKRPTFGFVTFAAACLFLAVSIPLGQADGAVGVAAATVIGPTVGFIAMFAIANRLGPPVPIQRVRLGAAACLAAACYAGARLTARGSPPLAAAWLAAYPAMLFAFGVVRVTEVRGGLSRLLTGADAGSRRLQGQVLKLEADERRVLGSFVAEASGAGAPVRSQDEQARLAELVGVLRKLGGIGEPAASDAAVGSYIVWRGAPAQRDVFAHHLWVEGADPKEVDELVKLYRRLHRGRIAGWFMWSYSDLPQTTSGGLDG